MAVATFPFRFIDKEQQHFDYYEDLFEHYIDADQLDLTDDNADRSSSSDFGNYFDFQDSLSGTHPKDSPLEGITQLGSCAKATLSETDLLSIVDLFSTSHYACGPSNTPNPSLPSSPIFQQIAANASSRNRRSASCSVRTGSVSSLSDSSEMPCPPPRRKTTRKPIEKLERNASTINLPHAQFDTGVSGSATNAMYGSYHESSWQTAYANECQPRHYSLQSTASSQPSLYHSLAPSGTNSIHMADIYGESSTPWLQSPILSTFDTYPGNEEFYSLHSPNLDAASGWAYEEATNQFGHSSLLNGVQNPMGWQSTIPGQSMCPAYIPVYPAESESQLYTGEHMMQHSQIATMQGEGATPWGAVTLPMFPDHSEDTFMHQSEFKHVQHDSEDDSEPWRGIKQEEHDNEDTSKPQREIKREKSESYSTRSPSPTGRSRTRSHRTSKQHRRSKSSISVNRTAPGNFNNFTMADSKVILDGVAPSGSSKTKQKRERETAEKLRREREAEKVKTLKELMAKLKGGHDLSALESQLY